MAHRGGSGGGGEGRGEGGGIKEGEKRKNYNTGKCPLKNSYQPIYTSPYPFCCHLSSSLFPKDFSSWLSIFQVITLGDFNTQMIVPNNLDTIP